MPTRSPILPSTPGHTTFKRLTVGETFVCAAPKGTPTRGNRFRKASQRGAFAILPATDRTRPNRGQTHVEVAFARSHAVLT